MSTIEIICQKIEKETGWAPAEEWTTAHFEELSERIQRKTNVQLSVATLKRVWGRVKYDSSPSRTTLDALAIYAGYDSWVIADTDLRPAEALVQSQNKLKGQQSNAVTDVKRSRRRSSNLSAPMLGILGALIGVLLVAGLSTYLPSYKGPPAEVLSFELEQLNQGLPATVQFRYVVNGGAYDSMQVQQSWDSALRHTVDPQRGFYACTYFYPGVYDAKLLLDTSIVSQQKLVIPSDGWLATIDQELKDAPIYFRGEVIERTDHLVEIFPSVIEEYRLDTNNLHASIHRIGGFENIETAAGFTLETSFLNSVPSACAKTELILFGSSSTVVLPFGKTGCSGEFTLFAGGKRYLGNAYDLSDFGVSGIEATEVKVEIEGDQLVVRNGEEEAFVETMVKPFGEFVGVRWRFEGLGKVLSLEVQPR